MTTIAAARDLLIAEGYAPEDVETSLLNLENEGLENPHQDVDNSWDQELEDAEIQTVREQIVSARGVTIGDITAALDEAGIDYRVEHPGALNASVHVGDLAMGPCTLDLDGNGLGVNTYAWDVGCDWHETVASAIERAAKYAR